MTTPIGVIVCEKTITMEFVKNKLLIVGVDEHNPVSSTILKSLNEMNITFDVTSFVSKIKDEYFSEKEHFSDYQLIIIVGMDRRELGNNLSHIDDYAFPHVVAVIGDCLYNGMIDGSDMDKAPVQYYCKQVKVDIGESYFLKMGFGVHKKTFLDEYQNMLISQESYSKKSA